RRCSSRGDLTRACSSSERQGKVRGGRHDGWGWPVGLPRLEPGGSSHPGEAKFRMVPIWTASHSMNTCDGWYSPGARPRHNVKLAFSAGPWYWKEDEHQGC